MSLVSKLRLVYKETISYLYTPNKVLPRRRGPREHESSSPRALHAQCLLYSRCFWRRPATTKAQCLSNGCGRVAGAHVRRCCAQDLPELGDRWAHCLWLVSRPACAAASGGYARRHAERSAVGRHECRLHWWPRCEPGAQEDGRCVVRRCRCSCCSRPWSTFLRPDARAAGWLRRHVVCPGNPTAAACWAGWQFSAGQAPAKDATEVQ